MLAQKRDTGDLFALKTMQKSEIKDSSEDEQIKREQMILEHVKIRMIHS